MKEKYISDISLIVSAGICLTFGLFALIAPINSTKVFHILSYAALITNSVVSFILLFFKHHRNHNQLINIIVSFTFGIVIYYNPTYYLSLFPLLFGLYLIMIGIFRTMSYIISIIDNAYNKVVLLIGTIINYSLGFFLIINPYKNLRFFVIIFGLYLLLIAINYMHDFLRINYPQVFNKRFNYYTAKLPIITMNKPFDEYNKLKEKLDKNITEINLKDSSDKPDLEILIHVKSKYPGKFGHADIIINDKVYSYGCYDDSTKRVFESVGAGVIFETNKDQYIKFCTKHSKKMMFCFGLKLNPEQKTLVLKKLKKVMSNTYRWHPDAEKDKENKDQYKDYASTLSKNIKVKFYKFKRSSYKIYFIFRSNCVKLVDDILGSSGLDLIKIDGFLVPGSYYDFLDKEFKLKNSSVISKSIYIYKE